MACAMPCPMVKPAPSPAPSVILALADDLNAAGAMAALHGLAAAGRAADLKASAELLGLLDDRAGAWAAERRAPAEGALVTRALLRRAQAKAARDFARADEIRAILSDAGVIVMDRKDA